jgi:hypothetical protein
VGFKGTVMSIDDLLESALHAEAPVWTGIAGEEPEIRHDAAMNAAYAATLLDHGDAFKYVWQFGILQTIDDYQSARRRGGVDLAATVFAAEPDRTGSAELDAAFAALADFLASRDGWTPPAWAADPTRSVKGEWYGALPPSMHDEARHDAVEQFRRRGVMVTEHSLSRA